MNNNNDIRAKFDALPSPEVSSESVRAIYEASPSEAGGKSLTSRVREWVKSINKFGKYTNDDTGWDIDFNKTSADNVAAHGAGPQKVALVEAVPDLIETGIRLETIPKNSKGLETHIFAGKATIDGDDYAVSFAVREDNNGKRYYDHSLTKIEALDRLDQAPKAAEESSVESVRPQALKTDTRPFTAGDSPTGTLTNILKKHLAVNNRNKPTREMPLKQYTQ